MKVWIYPVLKVTLSAAILASATGCNNAPSAPETAATTTTAQATSAQRADAQPAPSQSTDAQATHAGHDTGKMASLFPGAELKRRPWKLADDAPFHLNKDIGMKFKGGEKDWEVFEANKDGQRMGLVILTHSTISDKGEMHIVVGFNPKFKISGVTAFEDTDEAFKKFIAQFKGKSVEQPFKVGKDLKAVPGLPNNQAQEVADTVRRGGWIINEYFNAAAAAAHAAEHANEGGHGHNADGSHKDGGDAHHDAAPHDESKPHTHAEKKPHDESKPHTHADGQPHNH